MSNKNEFSFLFPAPRTIRTQERYLDIQNLCFPLEITKKYDFLFNHFSIKNKNRGLEIVCQEKKTLGLEEYIIECDRNRVVLSSNSQRGQFYALSTLLQILAFYGGKTAMPGFVIRDAPEIPFRGFRLAVRRGAFPMLPALQSLLLNLALLKFNHFCLHLEGASPSGFEARLEDCRGSLARDEINQVAALARRMGVEMFPVIMVGPASRSDAAPGAGSEAIVQANTPFPAKLVQIELNEAVKNRTAVARLDCFLDACRLYKAQGKRVLAWGDFFAAHPDLIRKIPQDVLIFNRDFEAENSEAFRRKAEPFKKHHIQQVLCPAIWSWERFVPAMRKSMLNIAAALGAVREGKLAGVMVSCCGTEGNEVMFAGIVLPLFQAGNLSWSLLTPTPAAFSQWALGRNEPDLFRVYTFLTQMDRPLAHSHYGYFFEDPIFAPYSRQGDAKEIEAHYRKAALYLCKRKIALNELTDFLVFAQQMYEFIADKVRFSSRLFAELAEKGGGEKTSRNAGRLLQNCEKIKTLYSRLWQKSYSHVSLGENIVKFDFLRQRFQYLQQSSVHPISRKNILLELENNSAADRQTFTKGNAVF